VREEVVAALLAYAAAGESAALPPGPSEAEFDAALAPLYERVRRAAANARGVAIGASPWQTTRRTRRKLNAAMPSIVADVEGLQHQLQRLVRAKEEHFPRRSGWLGRFLRRW
jgi:hypothetical protein